jgi:hypothetical protein
MPTVRLGFRCAHDDDSAFSLAESPLQRKFFFWATDRRPPNHLNEHLNKAML